MSRDWTWFSRELVILIHDEQLEEHGGASGLRDAGLLESALARPKQLTAYGTPDAADLAAAYAFGIARNHPFVDGNKRIAFFATDVFLRINGWRLVVDADEAHAFLIGLLESRTCDYARLLPWIREHLQRLR